MALISSLISLLIVGGFGSAVVAWWWPASPGRHGSWLLLVSFGAVVGITGGAAFYFVWACTLMHVGIPYLICEALGLFVVALLLWRASKKDHSDSKLEAAPLTGEKTGVLHLLVGAALLAAVGLALMAVCGLIARQPYGLWDAWAMWNLKAKFLFAGNSQWMAMFEPGVASHADYPLLQPAAIARGWNYVGFAANQTPACFAVTVLMLTVALVVAVVGHLRGWVLGALCGLVLLSSQVIIKQAATQYADTTLGLFIVGALGAVCLAWQHDDAPGRGRLMVLAGLLGGAAAWTKNEGVAFAIVLALSLAINLRIFSGSGAMVRGLGYFTLGAAPMVGLVVLHKLVFVGTSDLAQQHQSLIDMVTDWQRHEQIVRMGRFVVVHGPSWPVIFLLAVFFLLLGIARDRQSIASICVVAWTLLMLVASYYLVFLITPHDLSWHLVTSASRLFCQVWPGVVLLMFCGVRQYPPRKTRV